VTHQEDSITVAVSLEAVERRLRDIEQWARFIRGVSAVTKTGHERYLFRIGDAHSGVDLAMVCKVHPREHRLVWQSLTPNVLEGTLRLRPLGQDHTTITVSSSRHQKGLVADFADMIGMDTSALVLDVASLAAYVRGAGPAG
jgi:Polyketide cyclase / dehydrase and lipid transport